MLLIVLYCIGLIITMFINNVAIKEIELNPYKHILVLAIIWVFSPIILLGFIWVTIKALFSRG